MSRLLRSRRTYLYRSVEDLDFQCNPPKEHCCQSDDQRHPCESKSHCPQIAREGSRKFGLSFRHISRGLPISGGGTLQSTDLVELLKGLRRPRSASQVRRTEQVILFSCRYLLN